MGGLEINKKTLDKYIRFLKKFDSGSKKRLILKLTESLEAKDKKSFDIKTLYGSWIDSKNSDIIISEIRE